MNPKLAMKINRQAEDAYYGFMSFYRMPFLVTMDEVVEVVYQLDGPAPFRERLYEDDDFRSLLILLPLSIAVRSESWRNACETSITPMFYVS